MASASTRILRNIEEKFCQCCVCFEQYTDPRLLECHHRYCKKCLEQLIHKSGGEIKCPLCKTTIKVPQNGAEGFKKDFFVNEILEFIQVQNSLRLDQVRECVDCSYKGIPTAYCFKCADCLCKKCYEYHVNSKILKEHRQHVITLEVFDAQVSKSLENLNLSKEAPRCQIHEENLSQHRGESRLNVPSGVTCTSGMHSNRNIHDVISCAKSEKEKLKEQLVRLKKCKENLRQKSDHLNRAREEVVCDADRKLQQLQTKYQEETEKLKQERKKVVEDYQHAEIEVNNKLNTTSLIRKKELEEKISQLKNNFAKLEESDKLERETLLHKLKKEKTLQESKLQYTQERMKRKYEDFRRSLEHEKNNHIKKIYEMSDDIKIKINRCDDTVKKGSDILSSDNSLTISENAGEIHTEAEFLIEDTRKEFESLKSLSWKFQTNITFDQAE